MSPAPLWVPEGHVTMAVVLGQADPAGQPVQGNVPPVEYQPELQEDGQAVVVRHSYPSGHSLHR